MKVEGAHRGGDLVVRAGRHVPLTVSFNAGSNDHVTVFVGYQAPGSDSYVQIDNVFTRAQ